ncbi:hypothetical protein ACIREO_14185 [Streptomyces sp. NPDC102441]|uniref:hypothetical protein n=1 Tax=Streptomyces sp. NPDC102441 TaxID=3366176 RepID=UPI0038258881
MTIHDATQLGAFDHAATVADIIHTGGFTLIRDIPYTRLRGTTWDPKDVARQRGEPIPSGRQADILHNGRAFPVTSRTNPAISARYAAEQAAGQPGRTFANTTGTVAELGHQATHSGPCAECGTTFSQTRPRGQRRKWATTCPGCAEYRRRRLAAERNRRYRQAKRDMAP